MQVFLSVAVDKTGTELSRGVALVAAKTFKQNLCVHVFCSGIPDKVKDHGEGRYDSFWFVPDSLSVHKWYPGRWCLMRPIAPRAPLGYLQPITS